MGALAAAPTNRSINLKIAEAKRSALNSRARGICPGGIRSPFIVCFLLRSASLFGGMLARAVNQYTRASLVGHRALAITSAAPTVLVLKDDRLGVDALCRAVVAVAAMATVRVAARVDDAAAYVRDQPIDLLITDVAAGDADVIDELEMWMKPPRRVRRVFVVTANTAEHIVHTLTQFAVDGIFDQLSDGNEELMRAMQLIWAGKPYWSRSVIERLESAILSGGSLLAHLSSTERLALCLIGDGSDDRELAANLNITQSSARSIRVRIHEKLGLRTRAEAMKAAVKLGLLRIDQNGVTRFGRRSLAAGRDESLKQHTPKRLLLHAQA